MRNAISIHVILLSSALVLGTSAEARMYQWVNPASGNVQLSGTPPSWYRGTQGGPRVLVFDDGELVDDTFVTVDEAQRQVLRNTAFAGRGGGEVTVEAAEEQSKDELKAAMEKAYLLGIDVDAVTTEFVQEQEAVEEALSPEEITEKVSELKSLIELFDQRQLDQARSVLDAVPGAAPAATP